MSELKENFNLFEKTVEAVIVASGINYSTSSNRPKGKMDKAKWAKVLLQLGDADWKIVANPKYRRENPAQSIKQFS